jgi:hypothetical protein
VSRFTYGHNAGHVVAWQVRHIMWCCICEQRESAFRSGLCARCDADSRLLVHSALETAPDA